jgi:hypothetical protein
MKFILITSMLIICLTSAYCLLILRAKKALVKIYEILKELE